MNIGIIGSGGREHAICFKLKQSKQVKNLYCIPGNAGTIKNKDNKILSNGGRVLITTVVAKTLKEAVHFVEAPFKTKVVVYETAEDLLE